MEKQQSKQGHEMMFGKHCNVGYDWRSLSSTNNNKLPAVNHLGHFLLTNLLLDLMLASAPARIVVVSSSGYSIPGLHSLPAPNFRSPIPSFPLLTCAW